MERTLENELKLDPVELFAVTTHLRELLVEDETAAIGHVRLSAQGGIRRWYATDSFVAGCLQFEHAGDDCDVLLSPRLFRVQVKEDSDCRLVLPAMREDGTFDGPARLQVDALTVTQPVRSPTYPDIDARVEEAFQGECAVADLATNDLLDLVDVVGVRPAGSDESLSPPAFLEIGPDGVEMRADWPGWGESKARVAASTSGRAVAAVGPLLLGRLLRAAPSEVRLRVPLERGLPVSLVSGERFAGLLMPRRWPDEHLLMDEVREILDEAFGFGWLDLDPDGDLGIPFEDTQLYARTAGGDMPAVQVFSVLTATDQDPAMFERLNDLNASLRGCRAFWVDGQVLLEADLPAVELSPGTLRATLNSVADATRMVKPLFADAWSQ